jgi:hypothetical protein
MRIALDIPDPDRPVPFTLTLKAYAALAAAAPDSPPIEPTGPAAARG